MAALAPRSKQEVWREGGAEVACIDCFACKYVPVNETPFCTACIETPHVHTDTIQSPHTRIENLLPNPCCLSPSEVPAVPSPSTTCLLLPSLPTLFAAHDARMFTLHTRLTFPRPLYSVQVYLIILVLSSYYRSVQMLDFTVQEAHKGRGSTLFAAHLFNADESPPAPTD